ncbi:MAG: ATP synthase subunit I [Desulfovibrionales bacterium]
MTADLVAGGIGGAALGLFYFVGLWKTVKALPGVTRPRLWFWSSLLLRMGICLGGFWAFLHLFGSSGFLAACATFYAARLFVIKLVGSGRKYSGIGYGNQS